jgi:polyprenyl-phospho-N-acetylgalactosaminyl synthase
MRDLRSHTWVVIAAFNEGPAIRGVVERVVSDGWRCVVVDDGSRDDTGRAAEAGGALVLRHVINRGQGAALQTGMDYAIERGAEILVTFDADGQHRVEDIPQLLAALEGGPSGGGADVALGSRFLTDHGVVGAKASRRKFLKMATLASNGMSGLSLTDAHCGLRAIRAHVVPKLRITKDRMAHASELLRKLKTSGVRVVEVPVVVAYTEYSMSKGQSGLGAVRILFDYFFRQ